MVVLRVRGAEGAFVEGGVEPERTAPQPAVQARMARRKAAVEGVVGGEEEPDVEEGRKRREREQPEAWVRGGPPTDGASLEHAVEQGLDAIRARILSGGAPAGLLPAPARLGEGIFSQIAARVLRP